MAREYNQKNGFLHKLLGINQRELKRDVRQQVKYYIKNNRKSVALIKRASKESGTLKHSLLPSLQDKIIIDLRTKNTYDEISNQTLEKYIEAEVRRSFK